MEAILGGRQPEGVTLLRLLEGVPVVGGKQRFADAWQKRRGPIPSVTDTGMPERARDRHALHLQRAE